jgi:hypothetical protein
LAIRQISVGFGAICCMYGMDFHIVEMLKGLDLLPLATKVEQMCFG